MDKSKFTTVAILHETKERIDRMVKAQRRMQYDVIDIALQEWEEWYKNPHKKVIKENGKKSADYKEASNRG